MKPTSVDVYFGNGQHLTIENEGELQINQADDWLHVFGGLAAPRVLFALPAHAVQYLEYGYASSPKISVA